MTIVRVETLDIRVPLDGVLSDSVNRTDAWGFATVRLHTADGLVGTGYSGVARGLGNDLILLAVVNHYAPLLLGADESRIEQLWHDVYWSPLHWCGRSGVSHMALAAVDIALWDLAAQRAGLPLCDLLGGPARPDVPTYNTNGGWLAFDVPTLLDNVKASIDDGFLGVKMKVGHPDVREDLARVERVAEAIDGRVALMVDANQVWRYEQALTVGRELHRFDVDWVEEPMDPDNWRAHARLARSMQTPVAVGEHLYSLNAFTDYVEAGAATYLQCDATRVGGVTEFMRVTELARIHDLPMCPHAGDMMQVHQHLVFAAPTARWFEHIPWGRELFVHPAQIVNGRLRRPVAPGAGTAMHDDVVEKYLVARDEVSV